MLRLFPSVLFWTILLATTGVSCTSAPSVSISIASFTENYVEVSIFLERNPAGNYSLSAKFIPPNGYHLYSKDIPITGVDGLGRPTLLELTTDSQMKATGDLTESVTAKKPDFEPKELLVYPLGAVTLSLPVELPISNDGVEDEIKITYMACSASQCKPPVEEKIVSIRIPGAEVLENNQWKGN
jgi:hypothetical protein